MAFVIGLVLKVLDLANPALVLYLGLDCLALILAAMLIGLLQVAGSATTLPFLGPDVQRNFLPMDLPFLVLPKTCSDASSKTGTQLNNSHIFMLLFIGIAHTD